MLIACLINLIMFPSLFHRGVQNNVQCAMHNASRFFWRLFTSCENSRENCLWWWFRERRGHRRLQNCMKRFERSPYLECVSIALLFQTQPRNWVLLFVFLWSWSLLIFELKTEIENSFSEKGLGNLKLNSHSTVLESLNKPFKNNKKSAPRISKTESFHLCQQILRSHVMVRVGGGWDTLSHYLDKHDPCRCRAQHRSSVAAKLFTRTNQQNGIELHKAQVVYERWVTMTFINWIEAYRLNI